MSSTIGSSTVASSKKRKIDSEKNMSFSSVKEHILDQIIKPDRYLFIIGKKKSIANLIELQLTKKIPPKLLDLAWDMLSRSVSTTRTTVLGETDCTKWIWAIVSAVINYLLDNSDLDPYELSAESGRFTSLEADVSENEGEPSKTRSIGGKTDVSIVYSDFVGDHHLLPIEVKIKAIDGVIQSLMYLAAMNMEDKKGPNTNSNKVFFYYRL